MSRIPATVLTGYLGAGKTTALNHLLTADTGKRVAVLMNDFGVVNIDASLIESQNDQTISLTNGCVCCSISDDLSGALTAQVERNDPPDLIVLEASGVADPLRIAKHVAGWPGIELSRVITMVDAVHHRSREGDKYVGSLVRKQVEAGDLLVVNKTGLVSADSVEALIAKLRLAKPEGKVIASEHGWIAPAHFFGKKCNIPEDQPEPTVHMEAVAVNRSFWMPARPVDVESLLSCLERLPEQIHRVKGYVLCAASGRRFLVQKTGDVVSASQVRTDEPSGSVGIVILIAGHDIDTAEVHRQLDLSQTVRQAAFAPRGS